MKRLWKKEDTDAAFAATKRIPGSKGVADDAIAAIGAAMKQRRPQVIQTHWRRHQALADAEAKVQALEHQQ